MKYITFLIFLLLSLISLGQIDSKVYSVDTSFLKTKNLKGSLKKLEWESQTMDEIRSITIYEPFEFHKDSTYDVVMVTDNQAERVANAMENKMINQEIKPFIRSEERRVGKECRSRRKQDH